MIVDLRGLQRRRAELVERSTALRDGLMYDAAPIVQRAATVDRIVTAVRRHPLVSAVAVAAVTFASARSLLPWLTRALTLYGLLKRVTSRG